MKCEDYITSYLQQDRPQQLPLMLKLHILRCGKCRKKISLIRKGLEAARQSCPYQMNRDMSDSVMKIIHTMDTYRMPSISSLKWIAPGLLILGSIFLIPFNNSMLWLRDYFGCNLDIPLTLVMGLVITVYATLFGAAHVSSFRLCSRIEQLLNRGIQNN